MNEKFFPQMSTRWFSLVSLIINTCFSLKMTTFFGKHFPFDLNRERSRVMSKVNRTQLALLLMHMKENPAFAQNYGKESKEKIASFWKKVEADLNSAGPPMKNVPEWKKVWIDQKKYVRKKAAANDQNRIATGGGPNKEVKLSAIEEAIFDIMGTKDVVEGVESGRCFGLQPIAIQNNGDVVNEYLELNLEPELIETSTLSLPTSKANLECPTPEIIETTTSSFSNSTINRKRIREENVYAEEGSFQESNRKKSKTTVELVQKELEIQNKLSEKVSEAVGLIKENNSETQSNLKKIYRSLDRLSDKQDLLLKEMKRHNLEMEKLRKQEIEAKLEKYRLINEINEVKLKSAFRLCSQLHQATDICHKNVSTQLSFLAS